MNNVQHELNHVDEAKTSYTYTLHVIRMDQNNDKLVKESIFLCGVRDKDKDSASSGVSSGEDDISPCSSPPRPAITSS